MSYCNVLAFSPQIGLQSDCNVCILQAQTVANFFLAFDQNLAIVPVLNKIDMTSANPDKVADEMKQVSYSQCPIMHTNEWQAYLQKCTCPTSIAVLAASLLSLQ